MSGDNVVLARNTDNAPKSDRYAQTVAFSHYNNFSAQLPLDPATGKIVAGGAKEQAEQCLKNIKAVVESIDHAMTDVVRITIFVKNIKDVPAIDEVYKTFFTTYLPARTVVAVAALPMDALVQVEALLTNGEGTIPNAPQSGDLIKYTNNTHNAPLDPMSTQIVAFSHYNNISAQLPLDPETNEIVVGGVAEQAAQCLKNIKAIIECVDHKLEDAVKVNIFLKNIEDLDAVNETYATFFPGAPARRVVGASTLPMGALVQVDAIFGNAEGTPPIV
ncbi:MAG: Rid family hydrolase [Gordonibacter sp.]